LAPLEAVHGDPAAALDLFAEVITIHHDSGNVGQLKTILGHLAVVLDRFGRHDAATVIAGAAESPLTPLSVPEFSSSCEHLRDVLGNEPFTTAHDQGVTMHRADAVRFALAEITRARGAL
jgi:hypothetical protein